jgi:Spy/CpxP family protein refolding chaperone
MKKSISFVLVLTLVLGISVYALAHGNNNGVSQGSQNGYHEQLNLSAEQEEQMEKFQDRYYERTDELREKREELRELYFDKNASRQEIVKAQRELNQLRAESFELRTKSQLGVRNMMTSEQLATMDDYGMMGFGMMNGYGMRGGGRFRGHRGGHGMSGGHMMNNNSMMGW